MSRNHIFRDISVNLRQPGKCDEQRQVDTANNLVVMRPLMSRNHVFGDTSVNLRRVGKAESLIDAHRL
jgi:hypothetical protein